MNVNTASEEKMVHLVRNALLAAGQEMGEGDHWPIIKDTIHKVMKDWEDLKIERNVFEEIRKNYQKMLQDLETLHAETPDDLKPKIRAAIEDFQELYDAAFTDIDRHNTPMSRDSFPQHIFRAEEIIKKLEGTND